jgi:hypothetical protein
MAEISERERELLGLIERLTRNGDHEREPTAEDIEHTDKWGPMEQDEQGGCVWCGDSLSREQAKRVRAIDVHDEKCPWTAARRLLRDVSNEENQA